jgi:hypothetical protein
MPKNSLFDDSDEEREYNELVARQAQREEEQVKSYTDKSGVSRHPLLSYTGGLSQAEMFAKEDRANEAQKRAMAAREAAKAKLMPVRPTEVEPVEGDSDEVKAINRAVRHALAYIKRAKYTEQFDYEKVIDGYMKTTGTKRGSIANLIGKYVKANKMPMAQWEKLQNHVFNILSNAASDE